MSKQRAIFTPEFRLSFMSLYEPKADMNGFIRYQMEMLFPQSRGGSQFKDLLDLYNEALANAKWSAGGPAPRTFKECLIDGSKKTQEGRHGMWMLKANSGVDFPPKLILEDRRQAKPGEIVEGYWCRAIVTTYPYEARKEKQNPKSPVISRGISFNALTVQRTRVDEPFSNRVTDAEIEQMLLENELPSGAPTGSSDELDDLLT